MKAIKVCNVSKTYKGKHATSVALHDLNFSVTEGEITALVGPNGAGKTTALKLVTTLAKPTTGKIYIFDQDAQNEDRRIRQILGYVAQTPSLDRFASVIENMHFQASMQKVHSTKVKNRVEQLLEQFNLREVAQAEVGTLSGGQRRRLDIAMGLIHEPRLLILDEPTVNLDPDSRIILWKILMEANKRSGLTILFSTHYLEEADRYANQLVFIDKGRAVTQGTPDFLKQTLDNQNLTLLFEDAVCAAAAATILHRCNFVSDVMLAGARTIAHGHTIKMIEQVLSCLSKEGIIPRSATLSGPTLEDVYLKLTGRSFEQDDLEGQRIKQNKKEVFLWQ